MTFKPLNENDVVSSRTLLHEAIPLTGSIISGSYGGGNIKNYAHGMFQTVYDYHYLSSSANHIFDITCGVSSQTALPITNMTSKKRNIYGQMAQVLMGYDATGSIQQFDEDGDLLAGGAKMNEVIVIPFSRLLVKDEIKKETFEMSLGVNPTYSTSGYSNFITVSDVGASTEYRVNSPAGEYGILYATGSGLMNTSSTHTASIGSDTYWYAGLLFYQAGIAVLTGSIFGQQLDITPGLVEMNSSAELIDAVLTGSTINDITDGVLNRIENIQFNNTTELNSTVYFCRVNHNEFNYSSNPTYLENSRIRVKTQATDEPVSYITTIGLYNDRNELLATAKLSEALKKTPSTEFTIRARLDY